MIAQPTPTKSCTKCKNYRPLSEFHNDSQRHDGKHPHCKLCVAKYGKKRWSQSGYRDHKRQVANRRYETSEKFRNYKWSEKLLRRYGLTVVQYEEIYASQCGKCAICDRNQERLHVDHCHSTGVVRGLLCGSCNRALGLFQDDLKTLRSAFSYLSGCIHHEPRTATNGND